MMLRLGHFGKGAAYLNNKFKKFRGPTNKIYKGNKVVLLEENGTLIYVTLDSYNACRNKDINKMQIVEEITSWEVKRDNLKISTRSGMYKLKCKSPKKRGTKNSITGRNRGTAAEEKDQQDVRSVKH